MNTWFADKEIEVVEINGKWYALNEWNGEIYTDCWETEEPTYGTSCDVLEDNIAIRPIYKEIEEDNFELVGYEVIR